MEELLRPYPIFQYGFLGSEKIDFKEEVRHICERECKRYGDSWSCPPAVGTVSECQKRCLAYTDVLLFSTLAEVSDLTNSEERCLTKKNHEKTVHSLCHDLKMNGVDFLALSSDSCAVCDTCTYPKKICCYPDKMRPCIESYGILVTSAAEALAMDFFIDSQTILWFAMIFFHRQKK